MDNYFGILIEAKFLKRENRFRAEVIVNNEIVKAHVPNSGRMRELLYEGAKVWVRKAQDPKRKTGYDLLLVEYQQRLICLNAHLANKIIRQWLEEKRLSPFIDYDGISQEKTWGNSRFDFLLEDKGKKHFIEVKSVNLLKGQVAMFPDAPTSRGAKHMLELADLVRRGGSGSVVFLVMGHDAKSFAVNEEMDPYFAQCLREAKVQGVGLYAYTCNIKLDGIEFGREIPMIGI